MSFPSLDEIARDLQSVFRDADCTVNHLGLTGFEVLVGRYRLTLSNEAVRAAYPDQMIAKGWSVKDNGLQEIWSKGRKRAVKMPSGSDLPPWGFGFADHDDPFPLLGFAFDRDTAIALIEMYEAKK